jgi:hypothetical protein
VIVTYETRGRERAVGVARRPSTARSGSGTAVASRPMARSAARAQYRLRWTPDAHHCTTRSSSATYAYSIATTAAVTATHARTSRTRANAPAYCSVPASLFCFSFARAGVVVARAALVVVRFRDVFVVRVITHLRVLSVHALALVAIRMRKAPACDMALRYT